MTCQSQQGVQIQSGPWTFTGYPESAAECKCTRVFQSVGRQQQWLQPEEMAEQSDCCGRAASSFSKIARWQVSPLEQISSGLV